MRRLIVGLSGKKRSGKDTAATGLAGLGYVPVAFATPMKRAALALDPIVDLEDLDTSCGDYDCCGGPYPDYRPVRLSTLVSERGWEGAKDAHGETVQGEVRRTLQRLGTEMGRGHFGEDFWIDQAFAQLDAIAADKFVFTDVRFPNEAEAIESVGLLIRVERPGYGAGDDHPSETALDDYPFEHVVVNDGTIDDLRQAVVTIAREHFTA